MTKTQKKKLVDVALDYFEVIDDIYTMSDCIEVRGTMGGDLRCMRFYVNGVITER